MITSSTPSSGNKIEDKNEIKNLETEINEVITNCKSIIKNNYSVIKKKHNADKKKDKDLSKVTLETVAQDMSNILENLKTHLGPTKAKDSYSDVIPKLEELIKHKQITNSSNVPKSHNPTSKINPPGLTARQLSGKLPGKVNNNTENKAKPNIKPVPHSKSTTGSTTSKQPSTQMVRQRSNISKSSIGSKRRNLSHTGFSSKTSAETRWGRAQPAISREVYDPLGALRDEVERAKQSEKTFTIRGCFQAVRRALLSRGWVEKYHLSYRDRVNEDLKKFQHYSIPELLEMLRNKEIADVCKRLIKSKLLANHQVDFYWSFDYDGFKECSDKFKLTKINKLRRDGFSYTSKKGLCDASKKTWFQIPGLANMNHPRTYNLVRNGDTSDFIKDFSLTAAMSLLKWIMKNSVTHECKVISPSGKIPLSVFDFALNECYKFIKTSRNEVDSDFPEVFEQEWNEFLENYYKIMQFGNHFKQVNGITESDMVRKSNYILTHLKDHWPYLDMDGIMNIWILKPINGSQGVGIHICRTLKYILGVIKSNPNRRYIAQKYIERPLLIYNTKFDIRQWFLISSSVPLTIWIYKHSYLRFSSQTYSLRKLHESIHLTNNSVQSRYGKYQKDIALPPYNMWDSAQFKNYLSDIGYPNVFNDIIYPGMKQCITAAVLLHKDKLDRRRNCFELQGADFMLTEDFKPWLLEINSSPALHASTPVTARMCPAVLEDVVKVVIDYQQNNKANTGGFEMIFDERIHGATLKEHCNAVPAVKPNYGYTHPLHDLNTFIENSPKAPLDTDAAEYIKQIGVGLRKTLENLLQILKNEKQKRHLQKNKYIETNSSNTIITESRKLPLTRKEEPIIPVASQAENECNSSISSEVVKMSSEVSMQHCPEFSKNKSISVEKDSLPDTMKELQICSTSLTTNNDNLPELLAENQSDNKISDNVFTLVNYSTDRISEVMENFQLLCDSYPHQILELLHKQDELKLKESKSMITDIELLLNEIMDRVLTVPSNYLELQEKISRAGDILDKTTSFIIAYQADEKERASKVLIGCDQEPTIRNSGLVFNIQNTGKEIIEIKHNNNINIDYNDVNPLTADDGASSREVLKNEYDVSIENIGKYVESDKTADNDDIKSICSDTIAQQEDEIEHISKVIIESVQDGDNKSICSDTTAQQEDETEHVSKVIIESVQDGDNKSICSDTIAQQEDETEHVSKVIIESVQNSDKSISSITIAQQADEIEHADKVIIETDQESTIQDSGLELFTQISEKETFENEHNTNIDIDYKDMNSLISDNDASSREVLKSEYDRPIENIGKNVNIDKIAENFELQQNKVNIEEFFNVISEIEKLYHDNIELGPKSVEMEENANINKEDLEIQQIKENMELETSNTSSTIKKDYLSEKTPVSMLEKVVSGTDNTGDISATIKHQNISFVTTSKARSIKQMAKQSFKHLFTRRKK